MRTLRVLAFLLLTFGSIIGCVCLIGMVANDMSKEQDATYKNMVGKKVLVDKDSIMIVDYSILHQTYTLSNGKTISIDLIKNKK